MKPSPTRKFVQAALSLGIALAAGLSLVSTTHAAGVPNFTGAVLPPATGLGLPHNEDAEPGMAVDGGGTLWIASNVDPASVDDPRAHPSGVLSGTDVWKSTDGGQTFQWVSAPFNTVSNQSSAGGEDTDISAAPVKNSAGFYDIWVASLWVGSTNVAVSQDGGATWNQVPVNGEPAQDRPWLAATGACTVYLSYHAIAPYDTVVDAFSLPPCTGQAVGSSVTPVQTSLFVGNIAPNLTNRFGKIEVDNTPSSPHAGNVYEPMQGCDTGSPSTTNPEAAALCSNNAEIFMGVSTNGGVLWNDYLVHLTNATTLYIWPATAAVDAAGNVYIAWMEGDNGFAQRSYISVSSDGGQTWGTPVQINTDAASRSSAYPTLAASGDGHVDAAWYGTDRNGGTDDVNVMGQPATTANPSCGGTGQPTCWRLWWGTSSDHGATWTEGPITGTVHTGVLCVEGGGCGTYANDRNLLDDFGIVIDPVTGGSSLTFTNDMPYVNRGLEHTDYISEVVQPNNGVPELVSPWLALALGGAVGATALARRRRARTAA